jgi:phage-related protein
MMSLIETGVPSQGGHDRLDCGRHQSASNLSAAILLLLSQMWDNAIMETGSAKDVVWVASSLDDLKEFPEPVRQLMGFAIFQAQCGGKHVNAKPLKGFKGSGVLEVVEDFDGDTYRTVYTVRYADAVYVLHAFQKKSKKGIATPKHDIDLIAGRLRMAEQIHKVRTLKKEGT